MRRRSKVGGCRSQNLLQKMKCYSNSTLLLFLFSFSPVVYAEAPSTPSIVAKITSVTKKGRTYTFVVSLRKAAPGFDALFVQNPDEWGKSKIISKAGKIEVSSVNAYLYSQGSFTGLIFRNDDKFKFTFVGTAEDDGLITFEKLGEAVSVYSHESEICVEMILYVSNFDTGRCGVQKIKTDFVTISYPYALAVVAPPQDAAKKVKPLQLPDLPSANKSSQ